METSTRPEIIVLTGIPGSGKSTLVKSKFRNYLRINLDTVRTRRQEELLLMKALQDSQNLIIDNTNVTVKARKRYVDIAKKVGARIRSIYLACPLDIALERNSRRVGKERVPDFVVKIYNRRLEIPTLDEGFDSVEVINAVEQRKRNSSKLG